MSKQNYILTLFDENIQEFWRDLHDFIAGQQEVKYIGSQLEKCPETNKVHWQAFVHFHKQRKQRGTWFKKAHRGIHFEACSRLTSEAINYGCKVESRIDGPKEDGQKPLPAQQARKVCDYTQLQEWIFQEKWLDIPLEYVLRFKLHLHKHEIRTYFAQESRKSLQDTLPNPWGKVWPIYREQKQRHYWVYSRKPGVGKTYNFIRPLEQEFKAEIFMKGMNFQDMIKEDTEAILIDELNQPSIPFDQLNAMCDGYYPWNRKGKPAFYIRTILVIVCSNQPIHEVYSKFPIAIPLIESRFNVFCVDTHLQDFNELDVCLNNPMW